MKKSTSDKMQKLGWGGVVKTTSIHDVPFKNNPIEVITTDEEMEEVRSGFSKWMKNAASWIRSEK